MKYILFLVLLPVLAFASPADTLRYTVVEVKRTIGNCDSAGCIQASIAYPVFSALPGIASPAVLRKINAEMEIFALSDAFGDGSILPTASAAADSFVARMKDMLTEIGAGIDSYTLALNRTFEVTYNRNGALSVILSESGYSGGAHGFGGLTTRNYILRNGYEITANDFFAEEDAPMMLQYAERLFRAEVGAEDTASLADAGFWFRNNAFHYPQNFYLTPDAIVLHYNAYEVAPYSAGEIEIELPLAEIRRFIPSYGQLGFLNPSPEQP